MAEKRSWTAHEVIGFTDHNLALRRANMTQDKTRDGVVVVPDMELWGLDYRDCSPHNELSVPQIYTAVVRELTAPGFALVRFEDAEMVVSDVVPLSQYYSTKLAALQVALAEQRETIRKSLLRIDQLNELIAKETPP